MILNRINNLKLKHWLEDISLSTLIWFCVIAAALMAVRVISAQNGWITDDSVLYLEVARLFSVGQWEAGFQLYNWPLYPALIQAVHKLTGLGLQASAQCLVVLFFAVTSYYFCNLIVLAGGGRVAVASGTLILLSAPYIVGDVLPMLIRDQGFWALFLAGLTYFIRFYQTGRFHQALLWQFSMILAALFRIEGIAFLVLLPLSNLTNPALGLRHRCVRLLSSYSLTLTLAILSLIAIGMQFVNVESIGRLKDLVQPDIYLQMFEKFLDRAEAMGSQVLGEFLDDYAFVGLLITLFLILIGKTLAATGWATLALVFLGFRNKFAAITPEFKTIFLWTMGIALLNALFVLFKDFVLSGRYVISISFILMVIATIVIGRSVAEVEPKSKRGRLETVVLSGAGLLLIFNLIHNLMPMQPGYNYEQEAVAWVKKLTTEKDKVFYVSPRARFYAGAEFAGRDYDYSQQVTNAIETKAIHRYDYLVINFKHKQQEQELLMQLPEYQVVKVFEGVNGRKRMVILTRRNR